MHGWMRSHILQLLGCICEFEMLHAYLMLWGLKITDLAEPGSQPASAQPASGC